MEGAGLNATVLSYRHSIDFGFMACRELMPDLWELAEAVRPAFDELRMAAGTAPPAPVDPETIVLPDAAPSANVS
jgi:hypothetical protein